MFLLYQTLDEVAFWTKKKFLILLHAEGNNNWWNFKYWKYPRFDLKRLDKEQCLSDFRFTKHHFSVSYFSFVDFDKTP